MYKRVTALLLTAAPTWVGAADTQAVSVGTASVYPGNSTSVTLRAENFQNIASLEVYLYYDASALTVSSTSNGSMLSGSQTSVNTAEAGKLKLVTMALDGINGSGTLLTVYFRAAAGCQPGEYPIEVAIGGAYDANLAAVSVSSTNGSITVLQQSQSETFSIYANYSKSTLQKGDVQQFRVCSNSSSRKFASADFTVTYDPEVFQFEDAVLGSALTGEGAVYSVNSSVLGQVRITYASSVPVSASYLFYVNLKVIADTNGSTQIKATANNVYKEDLSAYLPGSCSYSFTLKKLPEVIDYPNAFLRTQRLDMGKQSTSQFLLEAGAGVAAADFALTYDPAVLRCVSVAAAEELGNLGGMVIINDNYTEGKIRFSYINMNAYTETEVPVITVTWEPLQSPGTHYQITESGVGVVDAQQNAVTLEYVTDTGCIYQPTVTPPTCLEDGYTTYTCNACGDFYTVDIVPMLGHDIHKHEAQQVTCTVIGWDAYEDCSRCDYTTYVEIPALGHDEIVHEVEAETCTGIGWDSYVTCSRCDYTTYEEIPALGHRVLGEIKVQADPLELLNNSATPFLLKDGVYYSQNHADNSSSSMQIKVLHDCTVELIYGVSSEANYDKLTILRNNTQLDMISGSIADKALAVSLTAGDVLTIRYSKDGSASTGTDQGWISLKYDLVWVSDIGDVSAETVEPTCTEAVVCRYCQTVVKEALGHDEIAHEAQAATCLEIGWDAYVTCSRCDYTTYAEIPALGHDLITHEAQVQTCAGIGWDSYETCSRCDYTTYQELPSLGHRTLVDNSAYVDALALPDQAQNPFVLVDGTYYSQNHDHGSSTEFTVQALYDCTVELQYGVSSESSYDWFYLFQNGTQLERIAGSATRTRTVNLSVGDQLCFRYQKDGSASVGEDRGWVRILCDPVWVSDVQEFPSHTLEPDCTNAVVCSYCDAVIKEALGHDEIPHAAQAVTCLEIGWDAYVTCSQCDYTTYAEIPAMGHSYGEWAETLAPTCIAVGMQRRDCANCEHYETQEIAALGHDMLTHGAQAATCTEFGWNAYETCSRCDYTTYTEIPALGHDEVAHEARAVTCLEIGWDAYVTCSRCDYSTYKEIPALDHDLQLSGPQAPTCTENGWEVSGYCSRCDYIVYVGIPALGHDITEHDPRDATCAEIGWAAYETCSRCDYTTYKEIPALGHSPVLHDAKAATCTKAGWESYLTCDRCDYTTYKEIPALGHDEIQHAGKEATGQENGWEPYVTCSRCDYSTYKEIPALGHDLISHAGKAATCEEAGWKAYETCSRCDYTNYQEIPALGHDQILHKAQMATCTEFGWAAYETCSRCDYTTYQERPALGHAKISHAAQAATCTEFGWDAYETCSRCDYTTYQELPALGHATISHADQAATCTKAGWESYLTCDRCDYTTYKEIPALGHDEIQHAGKEATGQENGWEPYVTCSRCDYSTYKEIPALGHDLVSYDGKAPTCEEAGWEPYVTCSRCGYSTYKEIPALGHDWTATVQSDTTLRAEGENCTQAHTYWNSCARCQAVSDTLYFTGAATGPHNFAEQVKDDAHRVPGDPGRYYYDCVHCDTMGQETFSDLLRGDMDNDGDVDVDDAIYLLQHILMPGLFPIGQSGDISADGQANVDDAIYLLQHVLMPGLFPLQ